MFMFFVIIGLLLFFGFQFNLITVPLIDGIGNLIEKIVHWIEAHR